MPTIAELVTVFEPMADAVLERGLSLRQAETAFRIVVAMRALEQCGGRNKEASRLLDCAEAVISKSLKGRPAKRKPNRSVQPFEKRHGGTPREVMGRIEV